MKRYRIAFFTADWNYELVESTLHGLKRFVEEHENVSVCIFDCFGKDTGTPADRSEFAIYDLPDLSQFDGVILQGSQIIDEKAREALARRVRAAGIPAMSIDCPIEGFISVGIDNREAQRAMAEHVIRDHGARRLVYITGMLGNGCPEGNERLAGFREACRQYGIEPGDTEVIEGTWRTSDGERIARRWMEEGRPLPDAFICANDEMALGLCDVLAEGGFRVPRDVIVVGFDNVGRAELSSPRLSTVNRDYSGLDYVAVQTLIDRIEGVQTPDFVSYDYGLICSESCGCHQPVRSAYIRDRYFQQTRFLKNFYIQQDRMAELLFEANTLPELMDIVEQNHAIFGCENIYLCVNDYYFDNYDKNQWTQDSETFGRQMVLAACSGPGVDASRSTRFLTRDLLPSELIRRERFLVFYPLHYNTYSIGYLVMDGISEAAKLNLHKSIFSFLEIAVENVRKKCLLRQLNEVLDDLYVHDALTGLYNRFGYERFAEGVYAKLLAEDGSARIVFVDMDDLKDINDRHGHEAGDAAIRAAAGVLREICGPEGFLMRYGGDEFLMITSCRATDLEARVDAAAERSVRNGDAPWGLGMSVGEVLATSGEGRSLESCVQEADILMYEKKKRRKAGRPAGGARSQSLP